MGFLVSLAVGLGLILSAETLTLMGNGIGLGGFWFPVFILAGAGIHLLGAVKLFGNMPPGPKGESQLLQRILPRSAAIVPPLAARVTVTIVAATSLMAATGYVFNEVFVYWFPNFLFVFLFLGLILIVNMVGRIIWGRFQIFSIILVLAGLGVLITAGLWLAPGSFVFVSKPTNSVEWWRIALYAFLIPIGYDLAFFAEASDSQSNKKLLTGVVLLGSLTLITWGFISYGWVSPETLAGSTIPYTVSARNILGQKGRIIMGIVILAGAGGAVNALFGSVSKMLNSMSMDGLVPAVLGESRFKGRLAVLILAAATGAMLISGMAGSSYLKSFLRGGLILWLFHYAVLHLAAFLSAKTDNSLSARRILHAFGGMVLGLAGLGLMVIDDNATVIAIFIVSVVCTVFIFGVVINGLSPKRG